jgi:neutral trehalase
MDWLKLNLAGIRTYYINRSQPPLFSEMVRIVYEATGNRTLLE